MFADWELIGVPHRVTIGDKSLKEGVVEVPAPPRCRCDQGGGERCAAHVKAAWRYDAGGGQRTGEG